jgi:DNA-binding NarL/FixJ family response regulator
VSSIAIVEDHQLLAETLSAALVRQGIAAAVLPLQTTGALLTALIAANPELVLLDLDLGDFGDGIDLVEPLHSAGIRTLVVSGLPDRLRIATALERGATGYQPKSAGLDALLTAIGRALAGGAAPDEPERHALLAELAQHRSARERTRSLLAPLTAREQATLRALADGYAVREIAAEWVVAEATVRTYVRGILTKLGVNSQLAAVALARRNGWLLPATAGRVARY